MLKAEVLADFAREENETSEDSLGQQREISVAGLIQHVVVTSCSRRGIIMRSPTPNVVLHFR